MSTTHDAGDARRYADGNTIHSDRSASERIRDQAHVVRQDVQELGGIVRDVAQEKMASIRDGAAEYYAGGQGKAREAKDTIGGFIRQRPVTAVLLGTGLGVLFGRFWMRR